jgi:hypothetical protein
MKIKLWTEEEIGMLLQFVKDAKVKGKAFENFAEYSGRTVGCTAQKYYSLSGTSKVKKKEAKIKVNEIQLPQGFEFNFVPKRAVMQKDSVTLYF